MSKKIIYYLIVSMLLLSGNILTVTAKKLMYLGHEYDGKVNDRNLPEGKGKIDIGGLIIKGNFNGKTINDATFETEWLKYCGSIAYDREDNLTLKQGGQITSYYYIKEELKLFDYGRHYGGSSYGLDGKQKSIKEVLTQDSIVNNNSLKEAILKLPYTFEMDNVPSELQPPTNVKTYGEYQLEKYEYTDIRGKFRLIYLVPQNPQSSILNKVKDYRDEQGRIWNYSESKDFFGKVKIRYNVNYPEGSTYTNYGYWLIAKPNARYGFKEENQDCMLVVNDEISIIIKGFVRESGVNAFLQYQPEDAKISLPSGISLLLPKEVKNYSKLEMELMLKEKVFSLFQTRTPFAASIFAGDYEVDWNKDWANFFKAEDLIGKYDNGAYIPNNE